MAVTACPTGIAHTYMAAEALEAAAAKAGVPIAVETQGSAGSKPLSPETIAAASAVIFAVDVGVRDRGRFAGKPVVSSGVKRPIDDGDTMIAEALRYADDPNAPRVEGSVTAGAEHRGGADETWGGRTRRVLMTGVSYMIPFVAAGGLLIALGFLFGGDEIVNSYGKIAVDNTFFNLPDTQALGLPHALFHSGFFAYLGALFFIFGKTAFMFFVPALAGYIAYAIADRPGIAPGFIMGGLATNIFAVNNGATPPHRPAGHGLPRRHHRRRARRPRRPLDRRLEGAGVGTGSDAGAGDPAADHDHRRPGHDRRPGQAHREADRLTQRRPDQHEWLQRDRSRAWCSA